MRAIVLVLASAATLLPVIPAAAQDGSEEIVVTAMRRLNLDDLDDEGNRAAPKPPPVPAASLMLRRTADFAVQQVMVVSDTLDEDKAREEALAMTRTAIDMAAGAGVQLSTGDLVVEPLTAANYKELKFDEDDDSDGQAVIFLVKVPLAPGIDAKTALARIEKFVKAVPAKGRAQMKTYSELSLSVVNPEQYRGAIIDLVAKDAGGTAARFGAGYGVEVTGLDRPVQWKRASLTEVQLFLPVTGTLRPRP